MEIFAKRLKELRNEKGSSLRKVASDLGIHFTTYESYEKNESAPKPEMIVKIANLFGVTPNYLLGVDDVY